MTFAVSAKEILNFLEYLTIFVFGVRTRISRDFGVSLQTSYFCFEWPSTLMAAYVSKNLKLTTLYGNLAPFWATVFLTHLTTSGGKFLEQKSQPALDIFL